jgi:hypothetical protein
VRRLDVRGYPVIPVSPVQLKVFSHRGSVPHVLRDGTWLSAARDAHTAADAETSRARQAEADARPETQRARDDAAREREALRDSCNAQIESQRSLTDAERIRTERLQLTTHITGNHGRPPPARDKGISGKPG